jgi:hypothetical protein
MARFERAALTAFSLSKTVRLALAKDQDLGPAVKRPREQHPRHVDLLIEPRDALGERALQQAVVLRDEGDRALIVGALTRCINHSALPAENI